MGDIYQIRVIGFKGETKTIDVATSEDDFNKTTVSAFKEKLIVKFPELKGAQFRMMFTEIQLEDSDTFSMRKILNKSTIFLIIRMPGGGEGGIPPSEGWSRIHSLD
ncbi:ubiquitin-like [Silurus asotus]|uniref:Ubiquitin-like n=1 Tax=Silurus asotus TaxID=30991 RepID=A0AAD5FAQ0_SILAS|nr:ubiquitin-like [Silurus asotus]